VNRQNRLHGLSALMYRCTTNVNGFAFCCHSYGFCASVQRETTLFIPPTVRAPPSGSDGLDRKDVSSLPMAPLAIIPSQDCAEGGNRTHQMRVCIRSLSKKREPFLGKGERDGTFCTAPFSKSSAETTEEVPAEQDWLDSDQRNAAVKVLCLTTWRQSRRDRFLPAKRPKSLD
jgi:hypothetical protein